MTDPWILVRDLAHVYLPGTPFAREALHSVRLELGAGEALGLVGSTGAGKSTLLQHLNGLYRPQAGQVRVFDYDLADPRVDLREVRRLVGLVFQRPEQQLFEQYVGDDVAYGPRALDLDREAVRERVRWAMNVVGLPFETYKDRLTWTLSGGEQRKAALAGVLALRPRVLLLDEPTAGLDPVSREELLTHLQGLRKEGIGLVVASHNMEDIARLTERICVLREGRVVLEGPTRRVLTEAEALRAVGLDVPPAVRLLEGLRAHGVEPLAAGSAWPLTMHELETAIAAWWEREGRR